MVIEVLYVVPLLVITNKNDICFCGRHNCQERHTSAYWYVILCALVQR